MDYDFFRKKFNISLNAQQEAAVRRTDGATLLLAVPGSGKTTVIVARLGHMIYCRGIDPRSILTMTYTVAATNDMRDRFRRKFGDSFADKLEFRTINGVCDRIIRYYEQTKGRKAFRLVDKEKDLAAIIRGVWLEMGLEYPSDNDIREARTLITYVKNMQLGDNEIKNLKLENAYFYSLYDAYRSYMLENRLMDYDDQLVYAHRILLRCPDILEYFRSRYRYINVDEAQDTSKIQHAVIRLLASGSGNLFMVGDEDQSIYGFRAAYPQALLDFERQWADAKVLLMETNYRSSGNIVKCADEFIKRNRSRHEKHMITDNLDGELIKHTVLNDYKDQYLYITKQAAMSFSSTAVLYRNNDSAIPLIDMLRKMSVPYRCRQMDGLFFTHYIVRDILDIIAFAYDPSDGEIFERIYYKLNLGLTKTAVASALERHKKMPERPILDLLMEDITLKNGVHHRLRTLSENFRAMLQETCYDAISRITKLMGYNDYIRSRHADSSKLDILMALALTNPVLKDFSAHLEALGNIISSGSDPDANFVLSTIHSSKGLEYDKVIMLDVIDGLFPSIPEPDDDKSLSDEDRAVLEEERRLFYVGITRAKRELEIVTYKNRYDLPALPVSSFITAILPAAPKPSAARESTVTRRKIPSVYDESIFQPGLQVEHKTFGAGQIILRNGTIISIVFNSGEVKKFDLHACLHKRLIQPC